MLSLVPDPVMSAQGGATVRKDSNHHQGQRLPAPPQSQLRGIQEAGSGEAPARGRGGILGGDGLRVKPVRKAPQMCS